MNMLMSDPNQLLTFVTSVDGSGRTNQLQQLGFVVSKIPSPGGKMKRYQHEMNDDWIFEDRGPGSSVLYGPLDMSDKSSSRTRTYNEYCGFSVFHVKHMIEAGMPYAPWVSRLDPLALRVLVDPPKF
jgi:hypothetical protein